MKAQTLTRRVETLEQTVQPLAAVPHRMTNLEGRMGSLEGRMGGLEKEMADLRIEMRQGFAALRGEIKSTNDETRQFMRVLHEDLIERIKRLGEAINGGTPRRPKRQ